MACQGQIVTVVLTPRLLWDGLSPNGPFVTPQTCRGLDLE